VQPGVLDADGQAQAGAAGLPGPGRVGAPEPVEHQALLPRLEAHAVVPDRDGHRGVVAGQRDHDRFLLAVLDRVADQVAQHPLDPARIDLRDHRRLRQAQLDGHPDPLGETGQPLGDPLHDRHQIGVLGVQRGEAGVEAADLEQVGEQALEPVQLGLQQLGAARHRRVEVVPLGEDQVRGHPYGGQRGPQLVRHVGGEPALQAGHLLEPDDLPLQVGRHLVERRREQREVILALDLHALVEQAGGEALGGPGGHPYRRHDHAGDQTGDHAEQDDQRQAGEHHRGPDLVGRTVLGGQRHHVVQLDVSEAGRHRGAVHQIFGPDAVDLGRADLLGHPALVGDHLDQVRRDQLGAVDVRRGDRLEVGELAGLHRDDRAAVLRGVAVREVVDGVGEGGRQLRVERLDVHGQLLVRVVDLAAHLRVDLVLGAVQQDLRAAVRHEPAERADQQAGRHQRDRDDAQLQRSPPRAAGGLGGAVTAAHTDAPIPPHHPQGAAHGHGEPGRSLHLAARLAARDHYPVPAL
jgi:hypothetical protein